MAPLKAAVSLYPPLGAVKEGFPGVDAVELANGLEPVSVEVCVVV